MGSVSDGRSTRVSRLQGFLEADPDNLNLRADLFDAALADGALDVASAQVEIGERLRPGDASWRHRRGMLLLARRQYEKGEALYTALLEEGRTEPAIRHNLAFAQFAAGRYAAAAQTLGPALDGSGEGAGAAWTLWLRTLHRLGKLDEAFDWFASRSGAGPAAPEVWGVAALIAHDVGKIEEAGAWSRRALAGRPDQLEAVVTQGSLALAAQDPGAALGWFERALRVNPGDGRSWAGVAFVRMMALDLAGAAEAFQRAVQGMPDHVPTRIGHGMCQLAANDRAGARASFAEAVRSDPESSEAHAALALSLHLGGLLDEARRELAEAVRLDPESATARYAQALLQTRPGDAGAVLELARRFVQARPARSTRPGA